jgi:hypothetical protein
VICRSARLWPASLPEQTAGLHGPDSNERLAADDHARVCGAAERAGGASLARQALFRAQVGGNPAENRKTPPASPEFAVFLDEYWRRSEPRRELSTWRTYGVYRIREETGFSALRLHGLRHTHASHAAALSELLPTILQDKINLDCC